MKSLLLVLMMGMASLPSVKPKDLDPVPPPPKSDRQKVLAVAAGEVGVVEKTGRNDGEVDKYLVSVKLGGSRAPYCAAFVHWVGQEALGSKNPYPRSAWSPDMVRGANRVKESTQVKGAEAFGIYFASKKRVAHTGLIESRSGPNFITIEGNTSSNAAVGSAADREGQGVYRKRRHWRTVYSVRDWLN